jgi:hypothetical protein
MMFRLQTPKSDRNSWTQNDDQFREKFCSGLCRVIGIPPGNIKLKQFDAEGGLIYLYVIAPHGKVVVDRLNGNAPDTAARVVAVRKYFEEQHMKVESLTLGEFGLKVEQRLMDPRFNKTYSGAFEDSGNGVNWTTPINQGGKPYHCPRGW